MTSTRLAAAGLCVTAALAVLTPNTAWSVDASRCTALVSIGNGFIGVRASGPAIRYTSAPASIDSLSLSPDASFVVYNTHDDDGIGRSHAYAAFASGETFELRVPDRIETKNFLDRMVAERPDAIAIRYSSHNYARYEWLSRRGQSLGGPIAIGSDCARSRSGRVACVSDNNVTLDDGVSSIFSIDAFENIPVGDEFELAPGTSHAVAGLRDVIVKAGKLSSDGLWVEISNENGSDGTFDLPFEQALIFPIMQAEEGAIWLHASAPHAGRITARLKYRDGDITELDPAIAIDARATRIAIARDRRTARELIVLKPSRDKAWVPDRSVRIDTSLVRRMYFADATTLYVSDDRGFGLVDLRRRTFERLPRYVAVEGPKGRIEEPVFDWACAAD